MSDMNIHEMPPELFREVKSRAALEGVTIRDWVLRALRSELKRLREQKEQKA